jgi:hypothetical protein
LEPGNHWSYVRLSGGRLNPPREGVVPEDPFEPWFGPPRNVVGHPLPLTLLLAQTENLAIVITDVVAFPTGFVFTVIARRKIALYGDAWMDAFRRDRERPEGSSSHLLQMAILLPDGSRLSSLAPTLPKLERPSGPCLVPRGGPPGDSWSVGATFWIWPLPTSGNILFECDWPSQRVEKVAAHLETALLVESARNAVTLWEDRVT